MPSKPSPASDDDGAYSTLEFIAEARRPVLVQRHRSLVEEMETSLSDAFITGAADNQRLQAMLRELTSVFGLTLAAPVGHSQEAAPFIDLLVTLRTELRAAKQWALADRVRDGLAELGVEVKDGAEGTRWEAR